MKHIFLSLMLATTISLYAYDDWEEVCCCEGSSRLYLGPQIYHAHLDVKNSSSTIAGLLGLDDFNTHLGGFMYGGNGGYEYKKSFGLYANLDLNYGQGRLHKSDELSRYVHEYDISAVAGYYMGGREDDCFSFAAYAGFDYLRQYHNLTDLHVKYRYSIYRIPLGLKWDYAFCCLCSYWTLGLNVIALPQVDSTVKINLLKGSRWSLAKRTDWIISIPLEYYSSACPLSFRIDMFWKRVGIGGSKAVSASGTTLGLPPSRWNAYGASFDLVYEF